MVVFTPRNDSGCLGAIVFYEKSNQPVVVHYDENVDMIIKINSCRHEYSRYVLGRPLIFGHIFSHSLKVKL